MTKIGVSEVFTDGNVTIATLSYDGIHVMASARRAPGDRPSEDIGVDLALGRALHKLSKRLMRRAEGAVRQASYVKAERERRREQPGTRAEVSIKTLRKEVQDERAQQGRGGKGRKKGSGGDPRGDRRGSDERVQPARPRSREHGTSRA